MTASHQSTVRFKLVCIMVTTRKLCVENWNSLTMPTASERTWPSDAQRKKDAGRTAGELLATKTRKVTAGPTTIHSESERKETTSDLPASSHEFRTSVPARFGRQAASHASVELQQHEFIF